MKYLFTSLLLTFLGVCTVNGQNKYQVTVSVQITYVYYNDPSYYDKAYETKVSGQPQTFYVCADTPEEAKTEAKSECSSVCSRNNGRKLGKQTVNGKTYYVEEYRQVYDASTKFISKC